MATYNKFNSFVEAIAEKVHNFQSDQIKIALTNSAPVAGNSLLSNITEISYTNLSSRNVTTVSSGQSGGTQSVVVNDITLTSTGGSTGPFRYVVLYNDTASNDELICWFDYGSSITLNDGESLQIDFGSSLFTLT
jgi:hypothetical protein